MGHETHNYRESYLFYREDRRIGAALGALTACFMLLVLGVIFMVQQSVHTEEAKRLNEQRAVPPVAQTFSSEGGQVIASQVQ